MGREHATGKPLGGGGRGKAIAFEAPKEFERLLGKNLAPVPKKTWYGDPPVLQLVISDWTPGHLEMHPDWFKPAGRLVSFHNTTASLPGHMYFTDDASCAMDAINLTMGQVSNAISG